MSRRSKEARPPEWPVEPKEASLAISAGNYFQTCIRTVENKSPFMRAVINTTTMATLGWHTDLPLLVTAGTKKIIVHAWPSIKIAATDISIDDHCLKHLGIKHPAHVDITPAIEFLDKDRIIVADCPPHICRLLTSLYCSLVIAPGSVVFAANKVYEIPPNEDLPYRVNKNTIFVSTNKKEIEIPPSLESHYEQLKEVVEAHGSVCIFGPSGCGKTTLVNSLISKLTTFSFAVFSVPTLLCGAFGEAERQLLAARSRDIVVLENGEVLNTDEFSRRLTTAIMDVCEHTSVILTTSDIDSLPKSLLHSGRISKQIEIESPTAEQRFSILSSMAQTFQPTDIVEAAKAATGFVGGDLQRLVSEAIIENTSLLDAVGKVKPASLRQITLEIAEVHWTDIGGYNEVKRKLQESVSLPLEKPECFKRLGIRPPRGVLLYGPPGCSKTLMAKAVATESKMNFIAVKGPELFSKFVGESEKAVASVFKKARAAAPTIVFFDEIDAMATRRGAGTDSGTNVTDRVLVQLLTEMDGVSTRFDQSVIVIGATNRPDLLDPALMRPGRFDRLVYISLPDEEARREIFRVHMSKMKFSQDIDPSELAKISQGYSGAEIAAVCREAAMNALRENPPAKEIGHSHMKVALGNMKPRTPQQLLDFYQQFEQQRNY